MGGGVSSCHVIVTTTVSALHVLDASSKSPRVGEREAMSGTARQVGKSQLEGEIHQEMY